MIHNEKYHLFPIITLIHNKLTLKLLLLMIYLNLNWKDYVLKLCIRAHILRHEISLKLLPIIQIVNCLELLTFLASLHCLASFFYCLSSRLVYSLLLCLYFCHLRNIEWSVDQENKCQLWSVGNASFCLQVSRRPSPPIIFLIFIIIFKMMIILWW